ncbi:hypothetical protein BDU57DRAFT_147510 [Ampelomyces quisqualis]|uniref:Uncharacterized protein n=1 Tax=Ampelomyces quisqualis TaxID=50730 RepID=A0A6A5QW91_AMPQU|nr:hypothetical protein BDU57DRAFT_147510 [Ampelomyces quisqualis]
MASLDLLADFTSFLGSSGVVFSPPYISSNGRAITETEEFRLLQDDVITGRAENQRPPNNMVATGRTDKQESLQHMKMQSGISAQQPQTCEQPLEEQIIWGDYTSYWFDGGQLEEYANQRLISAHGYSEYVEPVPAPVWTDRHTSEGSQSYLREMWAPYQHVNDINNIAPSAGEIYRGPCGDVRCNCQRVDPRDFNAYIPSLSEEQGDATAVFQADHIQRMNDRWSAMAAQEEQYSMSQAHQF